MKIFQLFLFAAAATVAVPMFARADTPPVHVRGSIVSITSTTLTVKTVTGETTTIALGPKTAYAGATPGKTSDIAPGKFLGIASVPGSGANRALEVVVFADSMRGAGEGDYAWDSPANGSRSTMTDGTVASPGSHSTMTNATAGTVSGSAQKTIVMNYKGGSRKLVVPANAPVVNVAPATKALLAPDANVFIIATSGDKPQAVFVVIGVNGTKPPM